LGASVVFPKLEMCETKHRQSCPPVKILRPVILILKITVSGSLKAWLRLPEIMDFPSRFFGVDVVVTNFIHLVRCRCSGSHISLPEKTDLVFYDPVRLRLQCVYIVNKPIAPLIEKLLGRFSWAFALFQPNEIIEKCKQPSPNFFLGCWWMKDQVQIFLMPQGLM